MHPFNHCYVRRYEGWIGVTFLGDGEVLSFLGRCYIIAPSSISRDVGQGLFIAQHLHVPLHSKFTLMSFYGAMSMWTTCYRLFRFTRNMPTYGFCAVVASLIEHGIVRTLGEWIYINWQPYSQGSLIH